MLEYEGKYTSAKVMIDEIDPSTVQQIYSFLNHPAFAGAKIRIMPDCHAGTGSCIGFTMPMNEYVIPNVVGVDIGCGVDAYRIGRVASLPDRLPEFDAWFRETIPIGFAVNRAPLFHRYPQLTEEVGEICGRMGLDFHRVRCSVGSMGGNNHFGELAKQAETEVFWLLVHSGSRKFGMDVCNWHQAVAKKWTHAKHGGPAFHDAEYMPIEEGGNAYLADMYVAQRYAQLNRDVMAQQILEGFFGIPFDSLDYVDRITSVHNFIDPSDRIIRKGSIRAGKDERILIPLNGKVGTLVCKGKGDEEWNLSAPHGAGRIMSRAAARKTLSLTTFDEDLDGVFQTYVGPHTLDEAPAAYKAPQLIIDAIGPTAEIQFTLKPVWNIKAGKGKR